MPVAARLKLGIGWLPANPLEEALLPSRPVWENLLLGRQRQAPFHSFGWILARNVLQWAGERLLDTEVACSNLADPAASLSGGNQQKLVLARVLAGPPRLAVLEQPGRGLDIRAQARLRRHILELNRQGVSFLIVSYDLDELLSLSHRIGVVYRGSLVESRKGARPPGRRWVDGCSASAMKPGNGRPNPAKNRKVRERDPRGFKSRAASGPASEGPAMTGSVPWNGIVKVLKRFPVSLPALAVGIVCCMIIALFAGATPFALLGAIREGRGVGRTLRRSPSAR